MAAASLQSRVEFNYSKWKHLPVGQCISSPPFFVGCCDWVVDFYPNGLESGVQNQEAHVSLYLRLLSETKEVHVECLFNLIEKSGRLKSVRTAIAGTLSSIPADCRSLGHSQFISTDKLENQYCKDGIVIVFVNFKILSAPSDIYEYSGGLCDDIKKVWGRGERFDVTFKVEGEKISAHRFMLAARSKVFEAELYGSMAESIENCIIIKDMKADVFKAMLCFIYSDNYETCKLQVLSVETVQGLLVAADRYALEKLKLQCERRLWVALSVDTVLTTMILAERHSSIWLREKCFEFASKHENFTPLALTGEYLQIMQDFPSLFDELRLKFNERKSSDAVSNVGKRQRTG